MTAGVPPRRAGWVAGLVRSLEVGGDLLALLGSECVPPSCLSRRAASEWVRGWGEAVVHVLNRTLPESVDLTEWVELEQATRERMTLMWQDHLDESEARS